jgi:hypothetical protein
MPLSEDADVRGAGWCCSSSTEEEEPNTARAHVRVAPTSVEAAAAATVRSGCADMGCGSCVTMASAGSYSGSQNFHVTLTKGYGETISTAIMGCAVLFPAYTGSGFVFPCIGFKNAGVVQLSVRMDNGGNITVWRGVPYTGQGTLLGTSGTTLSPTSYNYLEVQAVIGTGTSGSVTVRAGGVTILTLAGVNTSADSTVNVTQAYVGVVGATGSGNVPGTPNLCYFDDLVLLDTTGGAPTNTFLGDVRVLTTFPTGAGNLTQWTPLASTNVSQVQDAAMDSDTTYNYSGTNGQIDLVTQGGLSVTPLTIFAVKIRCASKLDSAGGDTLAGELRSASTNYVSAAQPVLSTYSYLDFIWTTDPGTGVAWTKTGVNAAQIGYNRVA